MKPTITPEELDTLRNPDRIFRALLALASLPEERKAFIRRAEQVFREARLSRALYARVLEIAFEYEITRHDMRPYLGEVSATDPVLHVRPPDQACVCGHPMRVHLRQAWTCISGGDCDCERFRLPADRERKKKEHEKITLPARPSLVGRLGF